MITVKVTAVIVLIIIVYFSILSFSTRHHALKTPAERQLLPCPNKPNCVLSTSENPKEQIKSFLLINNQAELSWQTLITSIQKNGGEILVNEDRYLHAVFTSFLFRFKDDLEAQLIDDKIEVRSASRAGKSDLGQNRSRVELIRSLYAS